MPLSPDQIDSANLPRATIGGYKAGPTTDLLHRVSWDYRQIVHQHDVVLEEAELLRMRVAELEQELQRAKQAVNERRDPDELTRVVLSAAQRAAREVREAARQEAETTLRKARRRTAELERQVANRRAREATELAALEATRARLQEEMRSALESLKCELIEQEPRPADQPESATITVP
jgi:cell division septum initiation protein DivIVA